MDSRFRKLPSDIVNLIFEYDGTYREKYNSVVEEINELSMMRYCLDCGYDSDCFNDDSGIDEYLEEMEDMEEPEYEPDEPPIFTNDDLLFLFIDEN